MSTLNKKLIQDISTGKVSAVLEIDKIDLEELANDPKALIDGFCEALRSPLSPVHSLELKRLGKEVAVLIPALQDPKNKITTLVLDNLQEEAVTAVCAVWPRVEKRERALKFRAQFDEAIRALNQLIEDPQTNATTKAKATLQRDDYQLESLALLPSLRDCAVDTLILKRLNENAIAALLPTFQQSVNVVTELKLIDLDARAIEALLPELQRLESKITKLTCGLLNTAAVTVLVQALGHPNCQITTIKLLDPNDAELKLLQQAFPKVDFKTDGSDIALPERRDHVEDKHDIKYENANRITSYYVPILQRPDNTVTKLTLETLTIEAVHALLPALRHPNCKVTSISIVNLDAAAITALLSALQQPESTIKTLVLIKLDTEAIKTLISSLQHSNITELKVVNLDAAAINALTPELQRLESKITALLLGPLDAEAAKVLIQALQHPNCQITTIKLLLPTNEILTILHGAFPDVRIMTDGSPITLPARRDHLDDRHIITNENGHQITNYYLPILQRPDNKVTSLSLEELTAEAISTLLPGLLHPNCKITVMSFTNLEAAAIEVLLPALQQRRNINVLNLISLNAEAITILIPTLQQPDSTITELRLHKLDAAAVTVILQALQHPNCQITTLKLFYLGDAEVKILQDAFPYVAFKNDGSAITLPLHMDDLYDSPMLIKADVLQITNYHLPILQHPNNLIANLVLEKLTVEATKALLPGLLHPNCKITVMSFIDLEAAAIEVLLPVLQHSDSKVTILDVIKLYSPAIKALLPALQQADSKITELRLNELDAAAVTEVLQALQHPNCQIKTLRLFNLGDAELKILQDALPHVEFKNDGSAVTLHVETPERQKAPRGAQSIFGSESKGADVPSQGKEEVTQTSAMTPTSPA